MKILLILATCVTAFLSQSEHEVRKARLETYPPTEGDFVRNLNNQGTAKVWGIHFDVAGVNGKSSGNVFEGKLHSDKEKTDARMTITLGNDVTIRLEKVPGSPISFKLNGRPYANLEVGDKVSIDKHRNVKINSVERSPQPAALK